MVVLSKERIRILTNTCCIFCIVVFRVLKEAQKSGAIVSSLFPETYKNRLMKEEELKLKEPAKKSNRLESFLSARENYAMELDEEDDKPIADLYPNCTVCFMDLVGFTKWSSTRDPADVFRLLQSVYGSFDKIAKRRRIFKVRRESS